MKHLWKIVAVATVALALWTAPKPAMATSEGAALGVINGLVDGAHTTLSDSGAAPDARFAQLKTLVSGAFAFDAWERFMLGDLAKQFDDAQLSEFRSLMPGYMARLYEKQFGADLSEHPTVQGAEAVKGDVFVNTAFPRNGRRPLPVRFRLRDSGSGPKIIDIGVAGISFLLTRRQEFGSVIQQKGVPALLDFMRAEAAGA